MAQGSAATSAFDHDLFAVSRNGWRASAKYGVDATVGHNYT